MPLYMMPLAHGQCLPKILLNVRVHSLTRELFQKQAEVAIKSKRGKGGLAQMRQKAYFWHDLFICYKKSTSREPLFPIIAHKKHLNASINHKKQISF